MDRQEPSDPKTPEASGNSQDHVATDDPRWLDQPGAVDKIIWVLCIVSALTVVADFFYEKHGHWHFQDFVGFDAIYGFVSCVSLVIAAKGLRVLLMRDEDYYD